jgi:hypothetical protein
MVKAEVIRRFLDDVGLDIPYKEAKVKFKKYGRLPESSFYGIRKAMRLEKSIAGITELVNVLSDL